MATPVTITRVILKNYKSIASCDVRLGPLTLLVGRNGSGKSNFLDALSFLADSLRTTLELALRERGGVAAVSRRTGGTFPALGLRVDFALSDGHVGHYSFQISARGLGQPFMLEREECEVRAGRNAKRKEYYQVIQGQVESSQALMPAVPPNRLYLVNASAITAFRQVYEALSSIMVYRIDANRLRSSRSSGEEAVLTGDGSNLPGVLLRLKQHHPPFMERIRDYLRAIVPDLEDVYPLEFGGSYSLTFAQHEQLGDHRKFDAAAMSDGSLRALGLLAALFQSGGDVKGFPVLIGLEEPELHLHPAATAALLGAMRDASELAQVLGTTQSAELLDDWDVPGEWIRAVTMRRGLTSIGALSDGERSVIHDHLRTAGELLRTGDFTPVPPIQEMSLFNG